MKICSFDIDGVIFNGPNIPGIIPGRNDVIITGRSIEEQAETEAMLRSRNISNEVYYNLCKFNDKSREKAGQHKANTLNTLDFVFIHYEDDPLQAEIIKRDWRTGHVILMNNPLVPFGNRRQLAF